MSASHVLSEGYEHGLEVGRKFGTRPALRIKMFMHSNEADLCNLWLQGMYLEAFRRVFDILEDSGWQLVREGEEEELNSLADLPDLPYMKQL